MTHAFRCYFLENFVSRTKIEEKKYGSLMVRAKGNAGTNFLHVLTPVWLRSRDPIENCSESYMSRAITPN